MGLLAGYIKRDLIEDRVQENHKSWNEGIEDY